MDANDKKELAQERADNARMTPIAGYRPQSERNLAVVNLNKQIEERLLRTVESMWAQPEFDKRWLSIAKTHFEEGFMAMNRAVMQPGRVPLPEDREEQAPETAA